MIFIFLGRCCSLLCTKFESAAHSFGCTIPECKLLTWVLATNARPTIFPLPDIRHGLQPEHSTQNEPSGAHEWFSKCAFVRWWRVAKPKYFHGPSVLSTHLVRKSLMTTLMQCDRNFATPKTANKKRYKLTPMIDALFQYCTFFQPVERLKNAQNKKLKNKFSVLFRHGQSQV